MDSSRLSEQRSILRYIHKEKWLHRMTFLGLCFMMWSLGTLSFVEDTRWTIAVGPLAGLWQGEHLVACLTILGSGLYLTGFFHAVGSSEPWGVLGGSAWHWKCVFIWGRLWSTMYLSAVHNHILRDSFGSDATFGNAVGKLVDMWLNMIDRATLAQV